MEYGVYRFLDTKSDRYYRQLQLGFNLFTTEALFYVLNAMAFRT